MRAAIVETLSYGPWQTLWAIRRVVRGTRLVVRDELEQLVAMGLVEMRQTGNRREWRLK